MLLNIKQLSIHLKGNGVPLVRNANFELDSGESLIILGESGSGKTLTCKALMGILNERNFAASGDILFAGKELLTLTAKEKRTIYGKDIVLIPQNPMTALNPSVRIGKQMMQTLRLHTGISKNSARDRCLLALSDAGLPEAMRVFSSFPHMLSGGMNQRVLIASAMMVEAKLIIADEPTTALDVEHRNATVDIFCRLRAQSAAILLVTHDFAVAARLGGRLLVMKDGGIVERGAVAQILEYPQHPYTQELIDASRLSRRREREVPSHAGSQDAHQALPER